MGMGSPEQNPLPLCSGAQTGSSETSTLALPASPPGWASTQQSHGMQGGLRQGKGTGDIESGAAGSLALAGVGDGVHKGPPNACPTHIPTGAHRVEGQEGATAQGEVGQQLDSHTGAAVAHHHLGVSPRPGCVQDQVGPGGGRA